jgi:hypothetical protein
MEDLQLIEYNEYETLWILVLEEIQNFTISSYQELERWEELQKKAQKARTWLEKVRKQLVSPYNDIVWQINAKAKELTKPIIEAESIIKERMLAFTTQEENPLKIKWEREVNKFEITDPTLVPRELCSPDESKIRKMIEAWFTTIAWVKVWKEKVIY